MLRKSVGGSGPLRGGWGVRKHLVAIALATTILLWPAIQVLAAQPTVTLIDVLVVYTPSARAGAGGVTALQAQIQSAVVEANTVFQNSGVNARLRLVHQQDIPYNESGNLATDLTRLSNPTDGYLD